MQDRLAANLERVQERLARAAAESGRRLEEISLLAVTKQHSCPQIRALNALGVTRIGENRVPELVKKREELGADPPEWHFVGPLQRNKARKCIQAAGWIHSVESERLLLYLDRIAEEEGLRPRILLEVNLSGEKQKHGVPPGGFGWLLDRAREMTHLELVGLMTIGPNTEEMERVRESFANLRELLLSYCPDLPHLSMGMSRDLEIAVAEGATLVRVGSALFTGLPTAAAEEEG